MNYGSRIESKWSNCSNEDFKNYYSIVSAKKPFCLKASLGGFTFETSTTTTTTTSTTTTITTTTTVATTITTATTTITTATTTITTKLSSITTSASKVFEGTFLFDFYK